MDIFFVNSNKIINEQNQAEITIKTALVKGKERTRIQNKS